jgi:Fe-S oxidoreductase/electron transfer flavoprotein alpha/beta subunit
METRELFWNVDGAAYSAFYAIGFTAIAIFLYGFARHFIKYARGQKARTPVNVWRGFWRMWVDLFSQRTVRRRDRYAGASHSKIFYGFVILFIGTSIITVDYDITEPLFGTSFWKGTFYLIFSLTLDIGGLGMILGILLMMWRRASFKLPKLDYVRRYREEEELRPIARYWQREDWVFMTVLLVIAVTGFLQEGVRLLHEQPAWAAWSPVGWAIWKVFAGLGMSEATAEGIRAANWWIHGMLALVFIAAIPWNKAKHIIAVMGSLSVRDERPLRRLSRIPEDAEEVGISRVEQFSWKNMLNFDACTKCGKCHDACPARTAGYPLSPRDLILDLRVFNDKAMGRSREGSELIGDVIDKDTLWACRSCGACQEICPVGIEHPAIIIDMRRHLVDQGDMDPLLQATMENIANLGNSFADNPRKRAVWVDALEFPVKDIREEAADNLWFVGDFASFDPRNQKVSQTVARLFQVAKVDYGLLLEGERTAGNDVRRVGEEGLYESLVEHNLEQMGNSKDFKQIITTDPHSYNTIKNEYPDFGEVAPIRHYSAVLADLLKSATLKVVHPLNKRVTLHDPCHLGRLNGNYDEPRAVLEAIGCTIVEMPRNRDNSFCCGAGGGRIWIPDTPGTEKPSENRMHEAAGLGGIDIFVTCCPKDLTMFEDARKTSGHEADFEVADLAELVAEAIDLKNIDLKHVPSLVERITDAASARVADVIVNQLAEKLADQVADAVAKKLGSGAIAVTAAPAAEAAAPAAAPAGTWGGSPITPAVLPGYDIPAKDGPRIMVAVKEVGTLGDEFEFTDDGLDIKEEFFDFILNEWDDTALEAALQTIEKLGSGEVVVVTVGPERAEATLRKVMAKGAHRGVRVWDESLAGADPVTVARALAGVAKLEEADLILAGAQSADQAQGATGTALARILGIPHTAVALEMDWDGAGSLKVMRELEGGMGHAFEMAAPAVVSIQTGANEPRYATMRMIKDAKKKPLDVVDGASVLDEGSAYTVRRMYVPEAGGRAEMLEGSPDDVAAKIAEIIREKMGG